MDPEKVQSAREVNRVMQAHIRGLDSVPGLVKEELTVRGQACSTWMMLGARYLRTAETAMPREPMVFMRTREACVLYEARQVPQGQDTLSYPYMYTRYCAHDGWSVHAVMLSVSAASVRCVQVPMSVQSGSVESSSTISIRRQHNRPPSTTSPELRRQWLDGRVRREMLGQRAARTWPEARSQPWLHVEPRLVAAEAMLLDMLTANAAARHGDSPPHDEAPSPTRSGSFLAQLPLSLLGSYLRQQTASPALPSSPPNDAGPSLGPETAPTEQVPSTPTSQRHVMPHDEQLGSPAPSRPVSSGSSAPDDRLKKRAPRPKTSFLFALPVQPNSRSKLYIRPKVLLQLHQVIAAQRPKPVYEVIPFSLLPQRSTRRLARTFNTRERLGPHDLLIVEAEAYTTKDEDKRPDDERWGSREVIGVISPARSEKGVAKKTEICMNDGMSRWEVSDMPNGSFEFNTTDDHGLTLKARWVLKPPHLRRSSGMSNGTALSSAFPSGPDDNKYTFSTISASSRRHPIIATMTRARIDVMDSYAMPSAMSPPTAGHASPVLTRSSVDLNSIMDSSSDRLPIDTDDALRRFIVVSGIYVAANNYAPADNSGQSKSAACAIFRPITNRTVSMSVVDTPRSASPASTLDEGRHSIHKLFRSGTGSLCRRTSMEVPSSPASTKTTTNSSPVAKTRGRRASSDAPARSMTGSMRKRYGLAFEDQALPESEEERQGKRSMELLRIRELALPTPIERPSMEASPVVETKTRFTLTAIPSPIVIPPTSDGPTSPGPGITTPLGSPALLSPGLQSPERARKSQSAYNPVTTAGLWDSGVPDGPRLRSRPTSMVVSNERRRKEDKNKRSKSESNRKNSMVRGVEDDELMGLKRKGDWYRYKLKTHLKSLFKREKA
ncbi:hypothetical protein T440DRAFT_479656 [Plenodomus tracheiphilus IPT5]|uniref:Uncharacterized protein n=1 Tax=Plenodomus tracheiphilus IPT5 TaxID=1408161 RepID=A0A6A7B2V2_9PLEO|nr:hypothetical protein T440DRAFT_479656 [Plenodomus tracheiphilus IPT5]